MSKKVVEIFADGSSDGTSTGVGGWGAVVRCDGVDKEISGFFPSTTNNRMELLAVIKALRYLGDVSCSVTICTDSQYVKNGITQWIRKWKWNGWRNSDKEPVKNKDLWVILDEIVRKHTVNWTWVRGHAGHPENERADVLAKEARYLGRLRRSNERNSG